MGALGQRTSTLIVVVMALTTPALAAGVLPFTGAFGNAQGCRFFNTGAVPGDEFFLLTPDTFASYDTACDFDSLVSTDGAVATVSGVCQSEGESGTDKNSVEIIDHGAEGYSIRFGPRNEFGPYKACPPVQIDGPSGAVQL